MILNGDVKMTYTMQDAVKTCNKLNFFDNFKNIEWPSAVLSIFQNMQASSNQVLMKDKEHDAIKGVRYILEAKPSTLRPIKSWVIRIEEWKCNAHGAIMARDILTIKIANMPQQCEKTQDAHHIQDICVRDVSIEVNEFSFNAIMAASIFISKIDAGRLPEVDKILSLYNLQ